MSELRESKRLFFRSKFQGRHVNRFARIVGMNRELRCRSVGPDDPFPRFTPGDRFSFLYSLLFLPARCHFKYLLYYPGVLSRSPLQSGHITGSIRDLQPFLIQKMLWIDGLKRCQHPALDAGMPEFDVGQNLLDRSSLPSGRTLMTT